METISVARILRLIIFIFCIFSVGRAFAAGGSCPTGATYTSLTNPAGAQVTLASYGITSCYFVAANGSDSNSGTSESAPWLHAPQMPSCSSSCAAVQNQSGGIPPGTGIILRGGDTFHFGNNTGSYTGGTWDFAAGQAPEGASGSPIYVGVDSAWYSGSLWARPILTGDNPVCNANNLSGSCIRYSGPATQLYYASSCPYQIGSTNDFFNLGGSKYYIIDNFELTGLCQSSAGQPGHHDVYFSYGSLSGPVWFLNNYAHGWSHLQFAAANGSSGCTGSAVCMNTFIFNGSASSPPGESILMNVIDGSDSDPVSTGFCFGGMYNVAYNVINATSQCVTGTLHLFHDNLYSNFYENGHSNVLESGNVSDQAGVNAVYNNVWLNLETTGGTGGVFLWPSPPVGTTDYFFNNVAYAVGAMEYFNVGSNGLSQGTLNVFNNTFQSNVNQSVLNCAHQIGTLNEANNHYINDAGSYFQGGCTGTVNTATPLLQTNAAANANSAPHFDQYNASETYVYSPATSTNSTVGTGTNVQSYCAALSTAATSDPTLSDAASACQRPIAYRCSYVTSTHSLNCAEPPASAPVATPRPTSGAWNIGAYQLPATGPNPPTNVTATPLQ